MGPGCPHTLCSLSAPDAPCSFPKVAVTNDHKLSDHRSLFSHGSRGRKSGVKVSEGLVTSGGSMGEACPRLKVTVSFQLCCWLPFKILVVLPQKNSSQLSL